MQTTFKLFLSCLFCFALTLVSGCGNGGEGGGRVGGFFTESVPSFTPIEQAEIDQLIAAHGRDVIPYYLSGLEDRDTDEVALKKIKYFVSQGAAVNAKDKNSMTSLDWAESRGHTKVVKYLESKGAFSTYKRVTGTVTFNGEPLDGAQITFTPKTPGQGDQAQGRTDANGRYQLTMALGAADAGTTPGDYLVAIRKTEVDPDAPPPAQGYLPQTRSLIPERYTQTNTSGLTATVENKRSNEINFALTSE